MAFVEFQRLATATDRSLERPDERPEPVVTPAAVGRISTPVPRDPRYHNRRLLVLFFDLIAMSSPDQLRAFVAAEKYTVELMSSADLIAVITNDSGGVRANLDFTDDRSRLLEAFRTLMPGADEHGDDPRDNLDLGSAFGQGSSDFHVFKTDRQLSALQSAVALFRRSA